MSRTRATMIMAVLLTILPAFLVFADDGLNRAQARLKDLGYDPGNVDGVDGAKTRAAVERFQRDSGLPVSGTLDPETREKLGIPHAKEEAGEKADTMTSSEAKAWPFKSPIPERFILKSYSEADDREVWVLQGESLETESIPANEKAADTLVVARLRPKPEDDANKFTQSVLAAYWAAEASVGNDIGSSTLPKGLDDPGAVGKILGSSEPGSIGLYQIGPSRGGVSQWSGGILFGEADPPVRVVSACGGIVITSDKFWIVVGGAGSNASKHVGEITEFTGNLRSKLMQEFKGN